MGLLLVGLMGFGASNFGGTIRSVGTVGDQEIGLNEYASALTQEIRAFEAQANTPISFPQAQAIGLDRIVLQRLLSTAALDNETSRLGLSVGDDLIRNQLVQIDVFQGSDGNFDPAAYEFILERQDLTPAQFEATMRREMARTLLQGAVIGGIPSSDLYAKTLATFVGEQRDFGWVKLTEADLTETLPAPTEEELSAYYDANPDLFTSAEIRVFTYAWLTPDMILEEVTIDETSVRELYDDRIADFVRAERRLVERLVMPDQATADEAIAQIEVGGSTFDALVIDRGLTLTDVDMGDVAIDELGDAGEAIFAAQPGDVVGPFDTNFGPALFRMNAILSAQETTFEEAAPQLRNELAAGRAVRVIESARDGIEDLMAGGATLEDLQSRTDLVLEHLDWTETSQSGIAAYAAFRDAAQAAEVGAYPELMELEDGGVFVLRLDEIRAPELIPLEDVRDQLTQAWNAAAVQTALKTQADDLAEALKAGETPEGISLTAETDLTRRAFVGGTPRAFLTEVFAAEIGDAIVIEDVDGIIVARIDASRPPASDDAAVAAETLQISDQTAASIAQDLFDIYMNALQSNTDVHVDQAAINAVHASFQ